MNWFRSKPTQQKYVEAAITVASNLYLHTIPAADDPRARLEFSLPDSRYRYLLFCLSTVLSAALAYDEKKDIQPETITNESLDFLRLFATEHANEYFDDPNDAHNFIRRTNEYFGEFLRQWSLWPELEKAGKNKQVNDLICIMLRTTESDLPAEASDMRRLSELALEIDCRLPTMRGALIELAKRG
ncbi:MAG: hypothetical protein DME97_00145 [Verrucomicrobia bacterium]|nr:MAG: hypothetical protein DME97_00145 [Verrucomicrobiota bacterium]